MYDFAYQKPGSLADAVKVLSADMDAKALAGGQTFIPVLKQRLNKPSTVVDLAKLGLTGITVSGDKVTIGAMTTHADHRQQPGDQGEDPRPAAPGLADRRRGRAPSRHHGRLAGQQRPGRLLPERAAGARRHDQDRPPVDRR